MRRVADLACEGGPEAWGLSAAALSADGWTACQDGAQRARSMGYEPVRFPSATGAGENLAVFLGCLAPDSYIQILDERELHPDRP